jgi:D-arabinose 1-dehydrogenase-like Zn-dependent alcohol dehydrogenase
MPCAGLAIFTPLIHNGAGPGKKFGVICISGLVSAAPSLSLSLSLSSFPSSPLPSRLAAWLLL